MKKEQQGFILAATLWMLAFMIMAASYFSHITLAAVEKSRVQQQNIKTEIALHDMQTLLLYLITTGNITSSGLKLPSTTSIPAGVITSKIATTKNIIPLDERTMTGIKNTYFSIQDEAGLVPVNSNNTQIIATLIKLLGIPSEEVGALIAKLKDYRDIDELYRINGAEKSDYEKQNLAPPINADLYTSWQTRNILGWAGQKKLWNNNLLPKYTNAVWSAIPNINTAPKLVLQTIPGVSATNAQQIIDHRQQHPFISLTPLYAAIGKNLNLDPLGTNFFPSRFLRISIWSSNKRLKRIIHVELTPQSNHGKPWRINTQYDISYNDK